MKTRHGFCGWKTHFSCDNRGKLKFSSKFLTISYHPLLKYAVGTGPFMWSKRIQKSVEKQFFSKVRFCTLFLHKSYIIAKKLSFHQGASKNNQYLEGKIANFKTQKNSLPQHFFLLKKCQLWELWEKASMTLLEPNRQNEEW